MTAPPRELLTFGCGAGTQSTAIYYLIRDGQIARPDAVLFADTGNEPRRVYANVSWLRRKFAEVGIPFYLVSRFGPGTNIADDVVNRRVYATIPAFTVIERTIRTPLSWKPCDCVWNQIYRLSVDLDGDPAQAAVGGEAGVTAVASFAPGTTREQIADHALTHLAGGDCEICADNAVACDEILAARALLALAKLDLPVVPEVHKRCRSAGRIPTSFHTYQKVEKGRIKRECTGKYKIEPIERKIRELAGARVWTEPCRWCAATGVRLAPWDVEAGEGPCSVCAGTGQRRRVGRAPKGTRVRHIIGFSVDEIDRVTTLGFPDAITPVFPLLDAGLSRTDCEHIIRHDGRTPVRSTCKICPNHGNRLWREMRDNRPDEWEETCRRDEAMREMPGLRGKRYLHASCVPLREANIDKPTPAELASAQSDVLAELDRLENGSPTGCSPYACGSSQLDDPVPLVDLPMPTVRVRAAGGRHV